MGSGGLRDVPSPFLLEALAAAPEEEAPAELVPQLAALWQRLSPSARRQVERALVFHLVDSGVRDRRRLMSAVASLRHPGRGAGSAEAEALDLPFEAETAGGQCECGHTGEAEDEGAADEAYDAGESEEAADKDEAAGPEGEDEWGGEAVEDEAAGYEATADEEEESGADLEDEDEAGEEVEGEWESPFPEAAVAAAGEAEALAGWDEVFAEERPYDENEAEEDEAEEEEGDFEELADEPEVEGETPTPAEIQASVKAVKISSTTKYLRRAPNAVDLNAIASINTPGKRAVFKALQRTWLDLRTLGRRTASGPRAQKELQNKRAQLTEQLEKQARTLKEWLQTNAVGHSRALAQAAKKIKDLKAKLSRTRNAAQAEAVRGQLLASEKAAQALTDQLKAAARTYEPLKDVAQKVHEVRVPSPSGEVLVRLSDNVVAFATDTAEGLDGKAEGDRPEAVEGALARSGISEDKRAILQVLSSLEGGFSAVNTWDRAVITFGFTQWTTDAAGDGTLCDLMEAIRDASPETYRRCFQRYGLDVERPRGKRRHFMVTLPDGGVVRAGDAARRVQTSVPHVAALSAAGMDPDVQTAQIKFAADKKIDGMLAKKLSAKGKAARLGDLLTSVYAVGVLTDRAAGTGENGTRGAAQRGFEAHLKAHPDADLTREADRRAAGTRVLAELEGLDRVRASKYLRLDREPGSFSA